MGATEAGIQNVIEFIECVKKSDLLKERLKASDFEAIRGLAKDSGIAEFTKADFQAYLAWKAITAWIPFNAIIIPCY